MNNNQEKYSQFALCREMLETPAIMRAFDHQSVADIAELHREVEEVMVTGEGSSRIFPAKRSRQEALRCGGGALFPRIEGSTQALEYDLSAYGVIGISNSGRTKEVIRLFRELKEKGHGRLSAITANQDTPLEELADTTHILRCGKEKAVAATKSVVEQALVVQALFARLNRREAYGLDAGAEAFESALTMELPQDLVSAVANARTVYFAGRNDGVAEELTLKTNEIVRKPSDYLEGTYTVHGVEEVMQPDDVVIVIDPFEQEVGKMISCLQDGVGLKVFAIASSESSIPTMKIPAAPGWEEYVQLAAGWNILVEAGLAAGIDLDKPERARKVGNEVG